MTWFYKRFVPVYIKHKVLLQRVDKAADLLSIDDTIKPKSAAVYEFVNGVQFGPKEEKLGLNPYSIMSSPWHDIALADNKDSIDELSESLKNSSARGTNEKVDNLKSIKPIAPIKAPKDSENDKKRSLAQSNFERVAEAKEEAKKQQSEEKEQSFFDSFVDGIKGGTDSLGKQIGNAAYDAVEGLKGFGRDIGSGMYDAMDSVQNAINAGKDLLVGNKGSAKLMMKILMEKGWTKAQAAGLAANVAAESGFRINALGDGGKAYGIAQWHPDRQLNFKKIFRKDIRESRFEEQVAYLDWELNNTEKKAGNMLRMATDPARAAAIVEQKFERSALGARGGVQPERVNAARGYFGFSDGDIQNSSDFSSKVFEHGKDVVGLGDKNFKGVPLSDLPIKSAEATAGGPARDGTMKLAEAAMGTFGGDIKTFTAFNDAYHQKNSPKSMHTRGLAFDIALKNPTDSEKIKNGIEGIGEKAGVGLNVINEYINPSAKSTGGHIHVNFKTLEDSEKFAKMYSSLIPDVGASTKSNPSGEDSTFSTPTKPVSKTSPFVSQPQSSGLIPMMEGSKAVGNIPAVTPSPDPIKPSIPTSVSGTEPTPKTSVESEPSKPAVVSEPKPVVKKVAKAKTAKKKAVNPLDASMVTEKDVKIPVLKNNKFDKVGLRSSLSQSVLPSHNVGTEIPVVKPKSITARSPNLQTRNNPVVNPTATSYTYDSNPIVEKQFKDAYAKLEGVKVKAPMYYDNGQWHEMEKGLPQGYPAPVTPTKVTYNPPPMAMDKVVSNPVVPKVDTRINELKNAFSNNSNNVPNQSDPSSSNEHKGMYYDDFLEEWRNIGETHTTSVPTKSVADNSARVNDLNKVFGSAPKPVEDPNYSWIGKGGKGGRYERATVTPEPISDSSEPAWDGSMDKNAGNFNKPNTGVEWNDTDYNKSGGMGVKSLFDDEPSVKSVAPPPTKVTYNPPVPSTPIVPPKATYTFPKVNTNIEPSGAVSFNREPKVKPAYSFPKVAPPTSTTEDEKGFLELVKNTPDVEVPSDTYIRKPKLETYSEPTVTKKDSDSKYDIANPINDLLSSVRSAIQPIQPMENPATIVREPKVEEPPVVKPYESKPVDFSPLIKTQNTVATKAELQRDKEIKLLERVVELLEKKETAAPAAAPQSQVLVQKPKEEPRKVTYPYNLNRQN
jgi:hypothetical protein